MPLKKQFSAEFKALSPEEGGAPGEFSAIVAVYNNVDSAGDRIKSGAFDDTLKAWQKSGDPIPIILAHLWNDPWAHIGYADPKDVESIPGRGLHLKKGILDVEDNPLAQQVYRLMQRRTLKEFSFGYRVPEGGERKAQDGAYDLLRLDLIEFGPCLKGVNSDTELLAIKAEIEGRRAEEPTMTERLTRLEAAFGKAYVTLGGTIEARQESVHAAVRAAHKPEKGWVEVEGTYADRVVFKVTSEGEGEEAQTLEAAYEVAEDGTVTLGDASEVEIAATVTPKSGGTEDDEDDTETDEEAAAQKAEAEAQAALQAEQERERKEREEKALAGPDIELLLREQAIDALEVECADVFATDHALDDTTRTLNAYDRLLED